MVQVLKAGPRKPSFQEQLLGGLEQGLGAYEKYQDFKTQQSEKQKISEAYKELGIPAGTPPELAKTFLAEKLKGQRPEKPLTALQEAQMKLAEQKLSQGQSRQKLFEGLTRNGQESQQQSTDGSDIDTPQNREMIKNVDDNQLRTVAAFKGQPGEEGIFGNIAQAELDRRQKEADLQEKRSGQKRSEFFEINKPLIKELEDTRKNIPIQEQAIMDIESAALGVGLRDYLAETFHFEPLRTEEGAKLKTAIKDFFLSDLTRAGARPNMWIEQQLADALPKIGRDPTANLITAAGMKFKLDLAKERVRLLDELSDKYGYSDINLDRTASKMMKSYVEERQKILKDQIKAIKMENSPEEKSPKGYVRMQDPKTGEIRDILEGHAENAEKDGWKKT